MQKTDSLGSSVLRVYTSTYLCVKQNQKAFMALEIKTVRAGVCEAYCGINKRYACDVQGNLFQIMADYGPGLGDATF